jgi:methylated-DNA-[protein]-cysteine S-methyltransferase
LTKNKTHPVLLETERRLREYCTGKRTELDLKLNVKSTPFQNKVWRALLCIPLGETRSNREIAGELRNPGARRVLGAAAERNAKGGSLSDRA